MPERVEVKITFFAGVRPDQVIVGLAYVKGWIMGNVNPSGPWKKPYGDEESIYAAGARVGKFSIEEDMDDA